MSGVKKVNFTFLATLLFVYILSLLGVGSLIDSYAYGLIVSQIMLALPCAIYMIWSRVPYAKAVRLKKMRISDILLCILFFFLMRPLMTLVNSISMLVTTNSISDFMVNIQDEVPFIVALVITAVLPAIFEETVYRGVFYNEYHKARPLAAVFFSALLFGLMHGNLNQFSYTFVMGMVFAMLIEATDSILSTMMVHFCINGLSISLMYLMPKILEFYEGLYNTAVKEGNNAIANSIIPSFGSTDFSLKGIMEKTNEVGSEAVLSSIPLYLILAIIGTTLAFLVYRKIARRNGRWDYVKSLFSKRCASEYEMKCNQARYQLAFERNQMRRQEMRLQGTGQLGQPGMWQQGAVQSGMWQQGAGQEGVLQKSDEEYANESQFIYVQDYSVSSGEPQKMWVPGILERPTGEKLINWALVAGIVICVVDIVLNELVVHGVIVLK